MILVTGGEFLPLSFFSTCNTDISGNATFVNCCFAAPVTLNCGRSWGKRLLSSSCFVPFVFMGDAGFVGIFGFWSGFIVVVPFCIRNRSGNCHYTEIAFIKFESFTVLWGNTGKTGFVVVVVTFLLAIVDII